MKTRTSKQKLSELFQMHDSKYRLFLAISNAYNAYRNKNLMKHAEVLHKLFNIDFSKGDAVGFFLAQSTQTINKVLESLRPLCSSNIDPNSILPKELSALTFSDDNNKYINTCLPQILINAQQSYKMIEADNPEIAQTNPEFTTLNYTQSLKKLDVNIESIRSNLSKEINDDIILSLKKEMTLSLDEEKLIGSFLEVVLKHINEEIELLRKECLLVIFHVNQINFDDIKKSIKSSMGLTKEQDEMLPLKSYISLLLNNIQLRAKLSNKNELTELSIEKLVSEFTNLIKTAGIKQQAIALTQESVTIEAKISDDSKKQKLHKILIPFCEKESTIFQEMSQNAFDGFFYKLKENLNSNQSDNAYNKIYDILLDSSITPDNELLLKLMHKHANLLAKQRELTARDSVVFDMDEIPDSNSSPLSTEVEEIPDHDISEHLNNLLPLYEKILSEESVLESDFSPTTYSDQKHVKFRPDDGIKIPQIEVSEKQDNHSENQSEVKEITNTPKQTTSKSIKSIATAYPVEKEHEVFENEHEASTSFDDYQTKQAEVQQRVMEAKFRLEIAEYEQANLTLDRKVKQLNIENTELNKVNTNITKDNLTLKNANTQLNEAKIALESKVETLQNDNLKLNANNLELKKWKTAHKDDLKDFNNIKANNNQLLAKDIIRNFELFYKDYRNHASKGFWGMAIFASHGNAGREVASKFHAAFYSKMNSLILDYTQPMTVIANTIKTAFKELIDQQALLLSTSRHRAHSFRTYLLAYHDYLDAVATNNLENTRGTIVQKNHAEVYVADKTINIENRYHATFPPKVNTKKSMEYRLQYGKQ